MKLKNIHLNNFRSASDLSISLEPDITVFVGVNGSGKTTILDACAIMLSRLFTPNQYMQISKQDIQNGSNDCSIGVNTTLGDWKIKKTSKEIRPPKKNEITIKLEQILEQISVQWDSKNIVPILAYYRVDRAVKMKLNNKKILDFDDALDFFIHNGSFTKNTNFSDFYDWFELRENIENASMRYAKTNEKDANAFHFDPQLNAVRTALQHFLGDYTDFHFNVERTEMIVSKNGIDLNLNSLSDGEKSFITLVGDIARLLAIGNPKSDTPLLGQGVVLIDEIDLHLHPAWQRMIIQRLTQVFPNVQFLVSTHSPQILSEVKHDKIRLLSQNDNQLQCHIPTQSLGLNSLLILNELMDDPGINEDVSKKLTAIYEDIDKEDFESARNRISQLKIELNGSIPDILGAEATITMLESDGE